MDDMKWLHGVWCRDTQPYIKTFLTWWKIGFLLHHSNPLPKLEDLLCLILLLFRLIHYTKYVWFLGASTKSSFLDRFTSWFTTTLADCKISHNSHFSSSQIVDFNTIFDIQSTYNFYWVLKLCQLLFRQWDGPKTSINLDSLPTHSPLKS